MEDFYQKHFPETHPLRQIDARKGWALEALNLVLIAKSGTVRLPSSVG